MQQSSGVAEIAAALVKAQAEFPAVVKAEKAETGKYTYTYATLPDVQRAVLPTLAKYQLAVIQGTTDEDDSGFTVLTTLLHASGQWISSRVRVPIANGTAQAAGSGFSYGRRIGLVGALGIVTDDEDDDGAKATEGGLPKALVMPGRPEKWGGNGGKPLADVPTHALEGFVRWCQQDPERDEKFKAHTEAATLILEERREAGDTEADPLEPY